MKIAILIPSTTRGREWECITETYLFNSILSFVNKSNKSYNYKFYIGVDKDDPIYSIREQKEKIYSLCRTWSNVNIQFYPYEESIEKGHLSVMWNVLYKKALEEHYDYFWSCGDDILYLDDGWLDDCIQGLKKNKNLGCAGTYNGNGRIITQFLVHKTHYDIFNFLFNPKIKNWYLDDHLNELYHPNFLHVVPKRCMNIGGEERYTIEQAPFYKDLVIEDKNKLISWIKVNGGFNHYLAGKGREGKLGLVR